jgi:hypothetical protein
MGQKTNPISLRVQYTNRSFDSAWYSKYFYGDLLTGEFALQGYVDEFLKCMKLPRARTSVQYIPGAVSLYAFMCFPKKSRESRSRGLGITPSRTRKPSRSGYSSMGPRSWRAIQASGLLWSKYWNHLYRGNEGGKERTDGDLVSALDTKPMSWAPRTPEGGLPPEAISLNPLHHVGTNVVLAHGVESSGSVTAWWNPLDHQVSSILRGFLTRVYSGCRIRTSGLQSVSGQFSAFLDSGTPGDLLLSTSTPFPGIPGDMSKDIPKGTLGHKLQSSWQEHAVDLQSIWGGTSGLVTALYGDGGIHSHPGVQWHGAQGVFSPTLHALLNQVEGRHKYRNLLQGFLSRVYEMPVHLWNLGVRHEWQGAGFVADEIAALLQQRIPFRRIKYRILRECTQHAYIAGIRIQCSGRVGGKSKKAQRAKVESVAWGQTSLHVFSSRIDFAARTAQTPLGSTGVKVWICYK